MTDYRDADYLERMYWDEGLSTVQLAEECGVARSTIRRWMNRHNIPRRDISEALTERIGVDRAYFCTEPRGYERCESWNGPDESNDQVYVHQLVAIAEGADPHHVFSGAGQTDVHHRNSVRWDNRPENIVVMDHGDHMREHYQQVEG